MSNEDERILAELIHSADKLNTVEPEIPGFAYFKVFVEEQQAAAKRSQRQQRVLFTIVAASLVSLIVVCAGKLLVFMVALQGAALAGAIAAFTMVFFRRRKLKAGTL
jgi:hypothetical protein